MRRDKRRIALLAAPAFALALAACGGGSADVSSTDAAAAPAAAVQEADTEATGDTEAETPSTDETTTSAAADPTAASSTDTEAAPERVAITRLSADEAIANAEVNQPNLQPAANVLDIETLAVADGSVQTLRGVVDGDRPVLLWFFSPH